MTHRNQPQRLASGVVVQAGIDLHSRGQAPGYTPKLGRYRAIVVENRMVDNTENLRKISVECDIIMVKTQITYQNVPVEQSQHGVNNAHDLWIPRATTRRLDPSSAAPVGTSPEPLNLDRQFSRRGSFVGEPTPFDQVDGDMVLVEFIEGNPEFPLISGCLPHQRTNRIVNSGIGWRESDVTTRGEMREDELFFHHYGTEIRVNEQGDLLIDTVGAYSDLETEDSSSTTIGQVRVRVKEGQRLTIAMGDDQDVFEVFKDGAQLRVDLGEGADQRIPLGDDQVTALKDLADALDAFASALATATPAPPNSALTVADVLLAYSGGPPGTTLAPKLVQVKTDLDAALSDLAKTKKT